MKEIRKTINTSEEPERNPAEGQGRSPADRPAHSFAVCAYGESPYLEACLRSLKAQTVKDRTDILICTSTPNSHISRLAEKYGIPLRVRDVEKEGGKRGIGPDWNFAFHCAAGTYVTLAHQDDLYEKHYTEQLLKAAEQWPDMDLFTCAAVTIKNGTPERFPGAPEIVKKLLRIPLRFRSAAHFPFVKRLALRFGNAVICPSVSYRKDAVEAARTGTGAAGAARTSGPFREDLKFVLDWEFLYDFAASRGRWICSEKPLMFYRVHAGAATAACIGDHVREKEELLMFRRLWPGWIAKRILRWYRKSYDAYKE